MPFFEVSKMSQKKEFVSFATNPKINFSELCKSYKITRQTGYKWLNRFKKFGFSGLEDLSQKPKFSPNSTPQNIVDFILKTRLKHPCWGAKKIKRILQNNNFENSPSHVTINKILQAHNLINEKISKETQKIIRFEHENPNDLWQMDFKGDFAINSKERCFPLTVLDDASRFAVCVKSCQNQQRISVLNALIETFENYGLPSRILIDNGTPWATIEIENRLTKLSVGSLNSE
jgi:transposase